MATSSEAGGKPGPLPRRGRKPRPRRCVIQLRVRQGGKVIPYYSVTVATEPDLAMKRIQEAFFGDRIK